MPINTSTGIPPKGRAPTQHSLFQQVLPFGALGRAFRVYPGEWRLLAWVTLIQLIMSVSTIMINNVAQTAFLKRFGVEKLPVVFLSEALITFVVAGGLSMLMERFRSLRVFTGLLVFYGICVGLIRPLLSTDAQWVYPVLFILKSQAAGLLPILFWDILGDLFTTQQSKRLYTLVVAGGVLGTSAGSIATRPMAAWLGTDNLLLVFAVGMGLAAALNGFTEKVTGAPIQPHGKKPATGPRSKRYAEVFTSFVANTRQSALLRYMIVLLAIPNMILPLLDYQFNVLVDNYFESEALMLQFFGLFRGISNATIFIALMLASRLISRWGVPRSLIFHPINYVVAFMVIFLRFDLIAGVYARFSTELIKTALNNPARAVLYNFFPQHLRGTVRVALRGGVVRLSDFAGSGFLALIRGAVDPRMLSLIAAPLAAIWALTTLRLKKAYPDILIKSLADEQKDLSSLEDMDLRMLSGDRQAVDTFRRGLSSPDAQTAMACAQFMLLARPAGWLDDFFQAVQTQGAPTQHRMLMMITADDARAHLPTLYRIAAGAPLKTLWVWLEALTRLDPVGSGSFVQQYLGHPDPLARREALVGMGRSENPASQAEFAREIRRLLDGDAAQKNAAIALIGKSGDRRFDGPLLETLSGSEDIELIEWALEGLARMRHPLLLESAAVAIRHPSARVRIKALSALETLGDQVPSSRFIPLLKDSDRQIRQRASAVIKARGPGQFSDLMAALAEPNQRQRAEIAELIRQLGVPGVAISRFVMEEIRQAYELRAQAQILKDAATGPAGRLLVEYLSERQAEKTAVALQVIGAAVFGDRVRVVLKALQSGDKREQDNGIEALENALHPDIRAALIPLVGNAPLEEILPIAGEPPAAAPAETLARLLATQDHFLRAIIPEVIGENPSLATAPGSAAAAADPIDQPAEGAGQSFLIKGIGQLRANPLFHGVPLQALALMLSDIEIMSAQPGDTILKAGSDDRRVILVCRGRLTIDGADRSSFLTGVLGDSGIAGDVACLSGGAQLMTVRCETAALLMVLPCEVFQRILVEYPVAALNLCTHFSRLLRKYHQQLLQPQ